MRIRIEHTTRYDYERPAKAVIQILRMTPRPYEGLHIPSWRVEVDGDVTLHAGEDALGNITHTFSAIGPLKRLVTLVIGEVETQDSGGVVRDAVERFPPIVYLRETALTHADAGLRTFAQGVGDPKAPTLDRLHALLKAIRDDVAFDTEATNTTTTAAQAFAIKRGVCQDLSHVFIACARHMGIPARYVSGHLARTEQIDQGAAHAWAEAYVENLGWVGFDAANGVCPTERYVRVGVALDYLGAAPVRGSRKGGGGERLDVRLRVHPATQPTY